MKAVLAHMSPLSDKIVLVIKSVNLFFENGNKCFKCFYVFNVSLAKWKQTETNGWTCYYRLSTTSLENLEKAISVNKRVCLRIVN